MDLTPDPSIDPASLVLAEQRQAKSQAISSLEDSPDDAARAQQLSESTGVHPALVYGNLEEVDRQHKAALTSQLLSSNAYLADYANSHPLAAKVSNDDWGQLDAVSNVLQKVSNNSILGAAAEGFKEGFDKESLVSEIHRLYTYIDDPIWRAMVAYGPVGVGAVGLETSNRLFQGLILGAAAGIGASSTALTGSEAWGDRLTRDMVALAQVGLSSQGGFHLHPEVHTEIGKWAKVYKAAEPYIKAGVEPPINIHPDINAAKIEQSKVELDNLFEALKESQKSATRERSPELYAGFIRQHLGDQQIGIASDAVRELYGDKPPTTDDGLLGFIPDLAEQMEIAQGTGGDIKIPVADWLAKVEPEVARQLQDFTRPREDGVTKEEAESIKAATEKPAASNPLDSTRSAANLEPIFGQRKLTLQRAEQKGIQDQYREQLGLPKSDYHAFKILDPQGKEVGSVFIGEEAGGKRLYVDDIEGLDRANAANAFGTSAMRDILRQLRHEFPQAEELTGFRVSGARGKAGTWESKGKVSIKLSTANDAELERFFATGPGKVEDLGYGFQATYLPEESYLNSEKDIISAIDAEVKKLGLADIDVETPAAIEHETGGQQRGLYLSYEGYRPSILVALNADDPVGVLRHEALHDLFARGFYTEPERAILERAAREGDWLKKHDIAKRYSGLKLDNKEMLEEAIADEFADWRRGPKGDRPIDRVFQKLEDFFEAIRRALRQVLGREPTADDLFHKADAGEIASREPTKEGEAAKAATLKEPELPGTRRMEDRPPFEGSFPGWMTMRQRERYLKLIDKRQREDYAALSEKYARDAEKRTTAEWKANERDMRQQVVLDMGQRPDLAADRFFTTGEILGGKATRLKISPKDLTDEQKASLPKDWLSADGINPDDIAGVFGYHSGSALVDAVGRIASERAKAGMSPKDYFNRIVDIETDARMEAKYGEASERALEEAKDRALSETQVDLLHEQTLALATKAGAEFSISKAELIRSVKDAFGKAKVSSAKSDTFLRDAGRAGRALEDAFLKDDYAEAFRQSQRQYLAAVMAKEAKGLEKERDRFDRLAKRFRDRYPDNIDPGYTEAIQSVLMKLDETVKRSWPDLQKEMAERGEGTLREFVEKRNGQGLFDGTVIPMPDWILDEGYRNTTDNLTVDEFRDVKAGLDALYKHGREENKVNIAGAKADLKEWVSEGVEQLKQKFPVQKIQYTPTRYNRTKQTLREYIAAIGNMETFFGRLDGRDPRGHFTKTIVYPGAEAANYKARLDREFHEVYRDLDKLKNPNQVLDAPFIDPHSGLPWERFTRKNLEAMIANIGNAGNWKALHEGFNIDPAILWNWIEKNTTAEDIDRAQRRGDMWAKAKGMHDEVERNVNGFATKNIEVQPFEMHGKEYSGWYHPIIDDPDRSPVQWLMPNAEDKPSNFWPSVATGFTKERTNAKHVLDMNLDMIPVKLNQVLHAIAFKDFVHNTAKIFRNKEFRAGVSRYYGKEYIDEMDTWLTDIAGNASHDSRLSGKVERLSNYFRQNVISNYIAFNPYTIQKHGLSAFVMSTKEAGLGSFLKSTAQVGGDFFYHAVADMFTKDPYLSNTLWRFIWDNSEEIQRRSRNWKETVIGQHDIIYGKTSWRKTLAEWGSKGVALSDMISAAPLWLAKYRESFAELGDHGPAVEEANRAVRRAHGSTAITNQPRFVRRAGPLGSWMTSVYGFFGTMMQRRIELAQDINDAYHMVKQGEITSAAKTIPNISTSLMAYVIWPVAVEEMVTSEFTDDHRGLGRKLAWGAIRAATDTFLYLRDLEFGLEHGREPGAGLAQGPIGDTTRTFRELAKKHAFSKENAGKLIQDTITTLGDFTGWTTKAMGSAARFSYDLATGRQKPKTAADYFRGITRGDIKQRIEK